MELEEAHMLRGELSAAQQLALLSSYDDLSQALDGAFFVQVTQTADRTNTCCYISLAQIVKPVETTLLSGDLFIFSLTTCSVTHVRTFVLWMLADFDETRGFSSLWCGSFQKYVVCDSVETLVFVHLLVHIV